MRADIDRRSCGRDVDARDRDRSERRAVNMGAWTEQPPVTSWSRLVQGEVARYVWRASQRLTRLAIETRRASILEQVHDRSRRVFQCHNSAGVHQRQTRG